MSSVHDIPEFIDQNYYICHIRYIKIDDIFVKVSNKNDAFGLYKSIVETPHFSYVQSILKGSSDQGACGYLDYDDYNKRNGHSTDSKRFNELLNSIQLNGYLTEKSFILVARHRLWPFYRKYLALDGAHRLAILKSLGLNHVNVLFLRRKQSMRKRICSYLIRGSVGVVFRR